VKWLLKQPAYVKHLSYAPQQRFEEERCVYSEMHTADWWWEQQVRTLPGNTTTSFLGVCSMLIVLQSSLDDGDTVVPMIFLSDATHLTNFSSDKTAWPVYMMIGNLSTTIRMAPSYPRILLIALLPIPIKMRDVPISQYDAQKEHNRMIQQHV
jgi:hypothetical protein